jgi:hypothetical protein
MTGHHLEGTPTTIEHRQDELAALLEEMEPGGVHKGEGGEVEEVPFRELIPQGQRHHFLAAMGISLRKVGFGKGGH